MSSYRKFTFAISSPDEFLVYNSRNYASTEVCLAMPWSSVARCRNVSFPKCLDTAECSLLEGGEGILDEIENRFRFCTVFCISVCYLL